MRWHARTKQSFVAVEVEAGMRLRSGLRRGVVADFSSQGCGVGRCVAYVADVHLRFGVRDGQWSVAAPRVGNGGWVL